MAFTDNTLKTPAATASHLILKASLLIALSGILYGFLGFLGTRVLQENLSVSNMLFWRFLIAGICMALLMAKQKPQLLSVKNWNKRALFGMFLLGAVGYAGASGFFFLAAQYTGTGVAMVIFFSYPLAVAFFSWVIHRQRFHILTLLCLVAMLVGLILLRHTTVTTTLSPWGIFFGILAALSYTLYVMGSKSFVSFHLDANLTTLMVCFGGAFIFLVFAILNHQFAIPSTLRAWEYLLALSLFATVIPIQLMLQGLKHVSSMRASIISVLEPLVTLGVGVVLLQESISHLQLLGIILLLTSTLAVQFQRGL